MSRNLFASPRAVLVAAVVSCFATTSFAAKTPPPAPGKIYFSYNTSGNANRMAGDGTGKTALSADKGMPSRSLHNGKRWFLRLLPVTGEVDAQGFQRYDVHAEREDGVRKVRLTNDPTMDYRSFNFFDFDWAPDENANSATIFGRARQFTPDGLGVVLGSGGIYSALLQFDVAGDVIGLTAQPTFLVSIGTWGSEYPNCQNRVSLSPDMTKLVCDRHSPNDEPTNQLVTVTVPGGVVTNLVTDAAGRKLSAPQWSPSGAKIAFKAARVASDLRDYIDTILPTGTGRMSLTSSCSSVVVQVPVWSPDSNFVAYQRINTSTNEWDIYRVTSTATGNVNLTADVPSVTIFGWR